MAGCCQTRGRKLQQQNTSLKNWIASGKTVAGPDNRIDELGSAGFWDKTWDNRSDRIAKRLAPGKKERLIEDIFGMLDEAGFHAKGSRVLDIGCGPGALSIPFARAGAQVTSLDISPKALEYVKDAAHREGLSIEPVECSWWTADIDDLGFRNKFDLVIGSMTPSIKDVETFDRMTACSRKYCYYCGSVPGGKNRVHLDLYKNILKTDPPRGSQGGSRFGYYFMYLYLNGYRPIVRIHQMRHRMVAGWEEAADEVIRSIERRESCTEETKMKIRHYFQQSAVNGKCTSRAGGYIGMLVWDVNR